MTTLFVATRKWGSGYNKYTRLFTSLVGYFVAGTEQALLVHFCFLPSQISLTDIRASVSYLFERSEFSNGDLRKKRLRVCVCVCACVYPF